MMCREPNQVPIANTGASLTAKHSFNVALDGTELLTKSLRSFVFATPTFKYFHGI